MDPRGAGDGRCARGGWGQGGAQLSYTFLAIAKLKELGQGLESWRVSQVAVRLSGYSPPAIAGVLSPMQVTRELTLNEEASARCFSRNRPLFAIYQLLES